MEQKKSIATKIINKRFYKADTHNAITFPIYRNAAFEYDDSETIAAAFQGKVNSHTYSRISNPTVQNLEGKIQAASGAEAVLALSSGMAAISNTFMTIAYAGSNIVSSAHLFGNTFSLFKFTLESFGVETRFVDTDNLEEIEAAIDENTCAFFCEIITNPHMEVADLKSISAILKKKKVPMIVDTTLIPWCGMDIRSLGIDIEIVSTTKYISGGGSSIGGAILDYASFDWSNNKKLASKKINPRLLFTYKLRAEIARNIGAYMAPDTAYMQALGLESTQLRYEKMSNTAYQLASFLQTLPSIKKVNYTELDSCPYKAISDSQFIGHPGAMFTINLEDKAACYQFMDKLKVIRRSTNLFENKTLAIHPESTIYGTFDEEMKQVMGIEDNLIRFSVGLEDFEDLKQDIIDALN